MQLTLSQKQTLKAWIQANGPWVNDQQIADALNAAASPSYLIYKPNVTQDEIMQNGMDWTRVDNLSVGKARIWEWMFTNATRSFDPSKANIRAGINAVWVGTAADLAVRAAVYSHCTLGATLAEKLLVTSGSGAEPAQDGSGPGVPGATGTVTLNDIPDIINS